MLQDECHSRVDVDSWLCISCLCEMFF